jgi:hypothetical protein
LHYTCPNGGFDPVPPKVVVGDGTWNCKNSESAKADMTYLCIPAAVSAERFYKKKDGERVPMPIMKLTFDSPEATKISTSDVKSSLTKSK